VDLSTAIASVFDWGDLDVTASDLVAGLVMIGTEQNQAREACRKSLADAVTKPRSCHKFPIMGRNDSHSSFQAAERLILSNQKEEDRLAILEGAHFMRLANAVYGKYSLLDLVRCVFFSSPT
jgi:hypothetical protein